LGPRLEAINEKKRVGFCTAEARGPDFRGSTPDLLSAGPVATCSSKRPNGG